MNQSFWLKSLLKRVIICITILLITRTLLNCNWGFSLEAAFLAPFLNDLLDWMLSAMEGFPHSVGGDGSGASSSKRPPFDLNFPKASEHEKEAGVGEQVSVEAQPQGESSSKCEASSRKEEKALNLNFPPHPREATHELFNDLMKADNKIDELMERVPSLRNARDLDAWRRELQEVGQFFAETEQRLKWAIENEKAMYAAQDEEWAQADLHSFSNRAFSSTRGREKVRSAFVKIDSRSTRSVRARQGEPKTKIPRQALAYDFRCPIN